MGRKGGGGRVESRRNNGGLGVCELGFLRVGRKWGSRGCRVTMRVGGQGIKGPGYKYQEGEREGLGCMGRSRATLHTPAPPNTLAHPPSHPIHLHMLRYNTKKSALHAPCSSSACKHYYCFTAFTCCIVVTIVKCVTAVPACLWLNHHAPSEPPSPASMMAPLLLHLGNQIPA